MPHRTSIDSDHALLYIRYDPPVTLDELREVAIANARPDRDALTRRVHDFRSATTDLEPDGVRTLASFVRSMRGRSEKSVREHRRLALLLSDDLAFGLGRMYGALTEEAPQDLATAHAFRSFDEAREWLELPGDYPDPRDRLA